jgi:hypothetical protein
MERRSDRIIAEWAVENRQTWVSRRDWHGINRLAGLCVVLLFSGLAADLLLGSSLIATLCWIGAAVSGASLFVRFYDRRFFITRPADCQDRR